MTLPRIIEDNCAPRYVKRGIYSTQSERASVHLTELQEQLILGSTLGNMSIHHMKKQGVSINDGSSFYDPNVTVSHAVKNRDYVYWKYHILENLVKTPPVCKLIQSVNDSFAPSTQCSFTTLAYSCLFPLFDTCYSDGGKRKITREWLKLLHDPISIATLYMDCGLPHYNVKRELYEILIRLPRSWPEELDLVREYLFLDKLDIETGRAVVREQTFASRSGTINDIRITKKSEIEKFVDLIASDMEEVPSMMRKIEPFL